MTGTLNGGAVVDVIHLVAELIENATKFSPPQAQVMLRAEHVPAGVAIDIEDRGLGMQPTDVHRMNSLLADPEQIDIGELLHDGRIGLYVVSVLARKHSVRVQLQRNIYGGTQAVVLLPIGLVGSENEGRGSRSLARSSAETAAAPTAHPTPRPPSAPAPVSVPRTTGTTGRKRGCPPDARPIPAPDPHPNHCPCGRRRHRAAAADFRSRRPPPRSHPRPAPLPRGGRRPASALRCRSARRRRISRPNYAATARTGATTEAATTHPTSCPSSNPASDAPKRRMTKTGWIATTAPADQAAPLRKRVHSSW